MFLNSLICSIGFHFCYWALSSKNPRLGNDILFFLCCIVEIVDNCLFYATSWYALHFYGRHAHMKMMVFILRMAQYLATLYLLWKIVYRNAIPE